MNFNIRTVCTGFMATALSVGLFACGGGASYPSAHGHDDAPDTVRFIHIFDNDNIVTIRREMEVFGPYLSARHASAAQDYGKAATLYKQVLDRHPDSATILGRAFMNALHAGRREEALALAKRIINTGETAGVSSFVVAVDAIERGNYDRALSLRSRPLSLIGEHDGDSINNDAAEDGDHDSRPVRGGILMEPFVLAWAYAGKGDKEAALAQLLPMSMGTESRFFTGLAHYHMAMIQSQLQDPAAAENFEKAVALYGGSLRIARTYAHYLAVSQGVEAATKLLLAFGEKHNVGNLIAGEINTLTSMPEPALLIATPLEGLTEAVYLAAASLTADSVLDPAMRYLHLTLFCDPDHEIALMLLAELHALVENSQAALAAYLRVPETSINYLEARIKAAYIMSDLGRDNDAIDLLVKAAPLGKGRPDEAYFETELKVAEASLLRTSEQFERAYQVYNDLLRDAEASDRPARSYWSLYYMRGMCLERLDNWADAEKDLLRALDLNPGSAMVKNYLGYSWIDKGLHLQEGRKLIEEAAAKRPRDGFIIDSLGWVQYKLGDYEAAAQTLERAVGLEPGDATIADHYGDALWRADRKIEARFQWRHALDLDPSDALRAQLGVKLSFGLDHASRLDEKLGGKDS